MLLTFDSWDLDMKGLAELAAMAIADRATILSAVAVHSSRDNQLSTFTVVQLLCIPVPLEAMCVCVCVHVGVCLSVCMQFDKTSYFQETNTPLINECMAIELES